MFKISLKRAKSVFLFVCLTVLLLTNLGCAEERQLKKDEALIDQYIRDKGYTASVTASGLRYVVEKPGGAEKPSANSIVTLRYKGFLLDGTVFDNGYATTIPPRMNLLGVVPGFSEGVRLFGRGGKGILFIPSLLGYGKAGKGSIPANTVLIFEIDIIDF